MRSILVAVGRTRKADECLRVAARIASATGAVLHAVHPLGPQGVRDGEHVDQDVRVERILGRIPAGVTVGTVQAVPRSTHEAVLDGLAASGADLVVASPTGASATWMDPALAQVVLRATPAVLVVREPVCWPPRRVLVPLLPGMPADATLRRVGTWARTLWGDGSDGPAIREIRVLHVPADVGSLHETGARVGREVERLRETLPPGATARLVTSIRWGVGPLQRIVRSRELQGADLLVLDRAEEAGGEGPADRYDRYAWFHLLASAASSALLLPTGSAAQRAGPPAGTAHASGTASPDARGSGLPGEAPPAILAV
jgi:hypothetical protein